MIDMFRTPALCPFSTFLVGFIHLNVFYLIVTIDGVNPSWKAKFDKVHHDGWPNIDFSFIFFQIFFPITNEVLLRLCFPYLLSQVLLPSIVISEATRQFWTHYSYFFFTVVLFAFFFAQKVIWSFCRRTSKTTWWKVSYRQAIAKQCRQCCWRIAIWRFIDLCTYSVVLI